ncbi:hypothetical protein [Klebsiella grimontii]|uniref:hypothetical protein n=1 Tax=Klebsiella grimontii TaxID=2058152 RepID=UPI002934DC37|nr:hypothetical protein [Klebsiella grimontii]
MKIEGRKRDLIPKSLFAESVVIAKPGNPNCCPYLEHFIQSLYVIFNEHKTGKTTDASAPDPQPQKYVTATATSII